jgi:putative redox protein
LEFRMKWDGRLKFTGKTRFGHEITTDGSKKVGGEEKGYQPLELMIVGLAGCTGIDIILIAGKMRQELTLCEINVNYEQREDHPRAISKAHIHYDFEGKGLEPEKIERILDLSVNKYCSVAATMSGITSLSYDYTIKNGEN